MSIALMTAAWALDLPTGEKIVLLSLADNANDSGHCWPSMATIAKRAGMTQRGAQLIVQRLEAKGHLHRQQVIGKGCNYYVHPRTTFAPEAGSPPNENAFTPERRSPKSSRTVKTKKASLSKYNAQDEFDEFWKAYPRRTAKLAAQKAFASAIKRGADPNAMTAAARSFAESPDRDPQFTPHPATWLNQGRYDDQPQEQHNGRTGKPERNKVTDNPMVLAFARMAGHIDADGNPTPGARRCDATGSPPSAREHSRPALVALPSVKHH